ncbi:MAG: RtcB family protein, partial [Gammaproteobacteria bacterium]|nr:RtcB family protein [Gammaproteobacteria bacterium]
KTDKEYNLLKDRFIQKHKPKGNKILDGHYGLDTKSQYGKDYIQDLHWCLNYALDNRKIMMKRVVGCITESLNKPFYNLNFSGLINRNHNHAELKDGLWIHRKGATHAEKNMLGVIPGNMLDGSFIVKGKGNPDSLYSSSHGAGRILSRRKAKETLKLNDFKDIMEGITASVKQATLDESPFAYKNIFDVMNLQEELVEVIAHVKPLINIKG